MKEQQITRYYYGTVNLSHGQLITVKFLKNESDNICYAICKATKYLLPICYTQRHTKL